MKRLWRRFIGLFASRAEIERALAQTGLNHWGPYQAPLDRPIAPPEPDGGTILRGSDEHLKGGRRDGGGTGANRIDLDRFFGTPRLRGIAAGVA